MCLLEETRLALDESDGTVPVLHDRLNFYLPSAHLCVFVCVYVCVRIAMLR